MKNKLVKFAEHVRKEQLGHGEHGDQEYIKLADEALEASVQTFKPFASIQGSTHRC